MATQLTVLEDINAEKIGAQLEVLVDGYDTVAEIYFTRSFADAPDVDGKVYVRAPKGKYASGEFIRVRVTEALDYDLIAEPIE